MRLHVERNIFYLNISRFLAEPGVCEYGTGSI